MTITVTTIRINAFNSKNRSSKNNKLIDNTNISSFMQYKHQLLTNLLFFLRFYSDRDVCFEPLALRILLWISTLAARTIIAGVASLARKSFLCLT